MRHAPSMWLWLCLAALPARAWVRGATGTAAVTTTAWVCGAAALVVGWRRTRLAGVSWFFSWWGAYPLCGAWLLALQFQLGEPSPVPAGFLFCCVALGIVLCGPSRTPQRLFARLNRLVAVSLTAVLCVLGVAAVEPPGICY